MASSRVREIATEPGEFSDSELHTSRIDQYKAQLDVIKHVATLDTGALLVIVAMLEKVFKEPGFQFVIGIGVLCFLASLIASGFAIITVLAAFPRRGAIRMDRSDRRIRVNAMTWTFLGFMLGMLSLAVFFGLNWFV